jgi:DNA/RNA endonuclease YhcR with UshA esterase domain
MMIDHKRLLVILVTLSLIGSLSLFFYSTTIKPDEFALSEITQEMAGSVVKTNGTISQARMQSDGSISMQLCDFQNATSITVYIPKDASTSIEKGNLTPGTVVWVIGEVTLYGQTLELVVNSPDDLSIISAATSQNFELWQIIESVEIFDGINVTTSGTIFDVVAIQSNGTLVGTAFELSAEHDNSTYSLACMIFGQDVSQTFADWDSVSVSGSVSYYKYKGCWQLVVDTISLI